MHAVVARSTLHDFEQARSWLAEGAIPMLREMDGFVGGQWVRLDESHGTSMVTFDSEEQAVASFRGHAQA